MIEIVRHGDQATVKPGQDLVASIVPELREELRSLLSESPGGIIVDLPGVEMIDSVGLGSLIAAHNSLSKLGSKLKVINVSTNVYGLFRTTRLDKHFEVKSAE